MNGKIREVEINALLTGDPEELQRCILTTMFELKTAVEAMPGRIETAIEAQRRRDRRSVTVIASAVGGAVGLATPFLLHLI